MTSRFLTLSAFSILLLASACGGEVGGGPIPPPASDAAARDAATTDARPPLPDGSTGGACATDAGCPSGEGCAWPTGTDSCGLSGTCVIVLDTACPAVPYVTACGCDGTDVAWARDCAFPAGWAPSPLEHMGKCGDAGSDAGASHLCPSSLPTAGAACPQEDLGCNYESGPADPCGVYALCTGGVWVEHDDGC
jgi:hypothetical protein